MTAGLLFGATEGALVSLAGALEAAFFAFLISRQQGVAKVASALASRAGFGAPIRRLIAAQLKKVESYVSDGGDSETLVKLALYRLVPHAPYTVANYLLGLTSRVSLSAFMISTAVGTAPWCAFYALVGSTGSAMVQGSLSDAVSVVMSGADTALAAAMGILLLFGPLKRAMNQIEGGGAMTA